MQSSFLLPLILALPIALPAQAEPLTMTVWDLRDLAGRARGLEGENAEEEFFDDMTGCFERLTPGLPEDSELRVQEDGYLLARLPRSKHLRLGSFLAGVRAAFEKEIVLRLQCLSGGEIDDEVLGLEDGVALLEDREALVGFLRRAQAADLSLRTLPPVRKRVLRPWQCRSSRRRSGGAREPIGFDGVFAFVEKDVLALSLRVLSEGDSKSEGRSGEELFELAEGQTAVRTMTRDGRRFLLLVTREP